MGPLNGSNNFLAAYAKWSVGGNMLLLVYLMLIQSVGGRAIIEQEVSVAGEMNVGKLNKPLMQELREIDMGNFLDPPNIFRQEDAAASGEKITVHLVSHSHMDVGWLKTVDQCYFGANNTIQRAGCQYILDTVVAALAIDKRRKFTYAEQAFFQRWYEEQTEDMKNVSCARKPHKSIEYPSKSIESNSGNMRNSMETNV